MFQAVRWSLDVMSANTQVLTECMCVDRLRKRLTVKWQALA
jgi:hypothetical protein